MLARYMSPAYVRGEAYLMPALTGNRAAVEFQKVHSTIDGLVRRTFSWGALGPAGTGARLRLQGDHARQPRVAIGISSHFGKTPTPLASPS